MRESEREKLRGRSKRAVNYNSTARSRTPRLTSARLVKISFDLSLSHSSASDARAELMTPDTTASSWSSSIITGARCRQRRDAVRFRTCDVNREPTTARCSPTSTIYAPTFDCNANRHSISTSRGSLTSSVGYQQGH